MKRVTKKKIKQAKVVQMMNGDKTPFWKFEGAPKEIIPTEKDVGSLVIVATNPAKRKRHDPHYRIVKIVKDKQGHMIVDLVSKEYGFSSQRLESVILNNKQETKSEELEREFEEKKNDRAGEENKSS